MPSLYHSTWAFVKSFYAKRQHLPLCSHLEKPTNRDDKTKNDEPEQKDGMIVSGEPKITLRHEYDKAGDYTPTFTIKSSDGKVLRLVASVTVSR